MRNLIILLIVVFLSSCASSPVARYNREHRDKTFTSYDKIVKQNQKVRK